MNAAKDVEVWRNVAAGISAIKRLDPMSREIDRVGPGYVP
jgi:hypothetical protein